MQKPALPADEAERLAALRQLDILDTASEATYDRLVDTAARVCGTRIALVSLIDADRQWFKARHGLDDCQTGRDISFCGHAILQGDAFIIPDTHQDPRFHDNPLVTGPPHIRFYAGVPLRDADGHALGTLCVIDPEPGRLSDDQLQSLHNLAEQAALLLAMRRANHRLAEYQASLEHYRREAEQERQLMTELMQRMIRPERLVMDALQYWIQPAEMMSGDLLIAERSPHGRYYVLLADARGHGLPAAVSLLPISQVFHTMVDKSLPLTLMVQEMDRKIRQQLPMDRFVAALLLCCDPRNQMLEVWNGGMPDLLYLNADGDIERRFDSGSLALGLNGETVPHTRILQWQRPGQLFIHSDGLTDVRDADGEYLGRARMESLLQSHAAGERFAAVQQAVQMHMRDQPAQDDISCALIDLARLTPEPAPT